MKAALSISIALLLGCAAKQPVQAPVPVPVYAATITQMQAEVPDAQDGK